MVVVGRISPQKDPDFLLNTLINLKLYPEGRNITLHWLGGGPPEMEKKLLDAGIEVSGMIPHTQLMQRLNDADLYLHTAAWEGMPLTLLEAAKLNIPMVYASSVRLKTCVTPSWSARPRLWRNKS